TPGSERARRDALARSLESPLHITLVQGISRGERMDLTLQKATELGVGRVVPVAMQRTVVKLSERRAQTRLAHWRAVVAQACQQCGRNRLPEVEPAVAFDAWLASHEATDLDLVLTPNAEPLKPDSKPTTLTLVIGPEGGLAERESRALHEHGFAGLALGPRILRTETAALAGIAVAQSRWGDFQTP
ncbi:MAG: 16S rRNA (uracil(1498)-N(3))-methyltransferase, partial [Pseudomonadota bacterium]